MITPNQYFDEIICLNLKKRFDKWKKVQERFIRESIHVKRFEGIDGSLIKDEFDLFKTNKPESRLKTVGAYAILLSFINIFQHIIQNKYERVLIFEDDVVFHKDFAVLFDESVNNIPENWDIWYLGCSQYKSGQYGQKNINLEKVYNNFYRVNTTEGFFAFAITNKFAKEMLSFMKTKIWAADSIVTTVFQENKNKILLVSDPLLVSHDYGFSNNWDKMISEKEAHERWFHRVYDKNIYY